MLLLSKGRAAKLLKFVRFRVHPAQERPVKATEGLTTLFRSSPNWTVLAVHLTFDLDRHSACAEMACFFVECNIFHFYALLLLIIQYQFWQWLLTRIKMQETINMANIKY